MSESAPDDAVSEISLLHFTHRAIRNCLRTSCVLRTLQCRFSDHCCSAQLKSKTLLQRRAGMTKILSDVRFVNAENKGGQCSLLAQVPGIPNIPGPRTKTPGQPPHRAHFARGCFRVLLLTPRCCHAALREAVGQRHAKRPVWRRYRAGKPVRLRYWLGYSLPPNLGLPTLANKAAMVMTSIIRKVYWPNTWKTPQANAASATQTSRNIMFFNITRTRKLKVNF